MILIIPEETFSPFNEDIERLQTNLCGFALDIENLQERVQSGDVTEAETRKVFSARGLRPLLPCHLRWQETAEGWRITWTRRGRINADTWEGVDIMLGEESELYRLRV